MPTPLRRNRFVRVLGLCLAGLVLAGASARPAAAQPAGPVTVSVEPSDTAIGPGGQVVFAITLDHRQGWHAHTNDPQLPASWDEIGFMAIPTTIEVTGPDGTIIGAIQWPEPHTIMLDLTGSGVPEPYGVFEGEAVAYVPVRLSADAEGAIELAITVGYQACDDTTCDRPQSESFTTEVGVDPARPTEPTLTAAVFAGFDAAAPIEPSEDLAATDEKTGGSRPKFLGLIPMPSSGGAVGVLVLALIAMLGGLVLNLTPCVLPVIPIKVLTLSQHAGNPKKAFYLGTWMALGVTAFWMAIGLPVALFSSITDPSRIFGIWWVTLGIGLLIGVMGVGIMGAFNISLPQKVYFINPKADSARGSFLFGVMTAVLGLPCFGFVAGALLAGAATLPAGVIMVIFTSLGLGMAAPYFVLALRPNLISKLPRTGPASELVKQVMGLLLLAAAAYFVGAGVLALLKSDPVRAASLPWWAKAWHWWLIGIFTSAAGGWLVFKTFAITTKPGRRTFFSVVGLVVAGLAVLVAVNRTLKVLHDFWIPYTEETYQEALAEGKVVVLDFTADWCLNCQALKAAVLDRQPVKGELLKGDVVPLIADNTSLKAPGWAKLTELGQAGIPLLVINGPGFDQPWMSNAYTSGQVMDAIERARGGRETAER
jgi:thiol:disulfide interchange protein